MDWLMVILRIIHIFGGVFWVGATYTMILFVFPTVEAIGDDSKKFMQHFMQAGKFSKRMAAASGLTVLSGLLMYGKLFHGLAPLNTGSGLALTLGGLFGLLAMGMGMSTGRKTKEVQALGAEMAAGAPKPEQLSRMAQLQAGLARSGSLSAILMTLSLLGMVLSEYFAI